MCPGIVAYGCRRILRRELREEMVDRVSRCVRKWTPLHDVDNLRVNITAANYVDTPISASCISNSNRS